MHKANKAALYVLALASWGWICGGMDDEAFSYVVGAAGGLVIFYLFYMKH